MSRDVDGSPRVRPCGILAVDKPAGPTSHDVVTAVRRLSGIRRVGHAGTLDPIATGVLVVLLGSSTRLARYVSSDRKTYEASIAFGTETDTCDREGEVVDERPVPGGLSDPDTARVIVEGLVGRVRQVPPAFSAIKKDGRKAYDAARAGEPLELDARTVHIHDAGLLDVLEPGDDAPLRWVVRLEVSKGTYVRAVARDLGRALGTGAHLEALRRTASGGVRLEAAHTLERIEECVGGGDALDAMLVPAREVLDMPKTVVGAAHADDILHGRRIDIGRIAPPVEPEEGAPVGVLDDDGRLLAVCRVRGDLLEPETVIPGGCA